MGCATLRNTGKIQIVGCDTKRGYATRSSSTTTPKLNYRRPKLGRLTPSPRDDNSTEFNSTTVNPSETESADTTVITVSVMVPASFVLLGGSLIYLQYRWGGGLRCGCIPYRRRMNYKFKNSNEDISDCNQMESELHQPESTYEFQNENKSVENIGPIHHDHLDHPLEYNELFQFCPKRTEQNLSKRSQKSGKFSKPPVYEV